MYIFKNPKLLGKAKKRSKENLRLLNMLNRYITDTAVVPVSILTRFWADQAAAITYKEIRQLIFQKKILRIGPKIILRLFLTHWSLYGLKL